MPKATSSRTPLPTSSSDFALPSSTASPGTSDDHPFLYNRFRRPSLLQKAGYLSDTRILSPLASSFSFHARRRSQTVDISEEGDNDKDKMMTDSSSSSETHTPPLKPDGGSEDDLVTAKLPRPPPSTPPRRKHSVDVSEIPTIFNRRLAFPLKQPRILTLLAQEARPEDAEVKSEAAFQRLVSSVSDLPLQPRTPRLIDRGRYPEEAGHEEEPTREDTPSDDEQQDKTEEVPFASIPPLTATLPINIQRPSSRTITPSVSVVGSINGDDMGMCVSETSSSFGAAMDVDAMPLGSPLLPSINQWRYTPPPTAGSSAIRNNKRKLDDRFDPYPHSSKRRAISPSIPFLRESHSSTASPMTRANVPRLPIAIPITIPTSGASSSTSSPTISNNYAPFPRVISITSSPTLRATLASPILRPLGRRRLGENEDEKEIQGAGEAVNGLSLGPNLTSSGNTMGSTDVPESQPK